MTPSIFKMNLWRKVLPLLMVLQSAALHLSKNMALSAPEMDFFYPSSVFSDRVEKALLRLHDRLDALLLLDTPALGSPGTGQRHGLRTTGATDGASRLLLCTDASQLEAGYSTFRELHICLTPLESCATRDIVAPGTLLCARQSSIKPVIT